MEMKIIFLVCAVMYSTVFITYALPPPPGYIQVLKACDDSVNSIDDVEEVEFVGEFYKDNMFHIEAKDTYIIKWILTTNKDSTITGNNVTLKCDSGEIKGTGEVSYVEKGNVIQDTNKLDKDTTYIIYFESKWDQTPKEGDNCDIKASITLDDVENSYCITDKAVIVKAH